MSEIFAYCAIFIFSILLYANTFNHGWVLDDGFLFKENAYVTSGVAGFKDILLNHSQDGARFLPETFQYRPVSQLLFALEWEISPDNPTFYHIMNVVWNALASIFLYYLLRRLFINKSWLYSFAITLIFTANPMHTEVVANIKSRDELCYFVFLLLAIIAALNYFKTHKNKHLLTLFLFFTLAFFSKESAITALVAIPLIVYFFGEAKPMQQIPAKNKKKSNKKDENAKSPTSKFASLVIHNPYCHIILVILISIALYLCTRHYVLHVLHDYHDSYVSLMQNFLANQPLDIRWATAITLMGLYLFLAFVPYQQSCDYSFAHFPYIELYDWRFLLVFAIYIAMLIFTIYSIFVKKQKSIFAFCFLFWITTMSIYSNTIYLIGSSFADRFLFVPVLATAIVFVEGISQLATKILKNKLKISRMSVASIVLVVVCLFSAKTVVRSADWKNSETLFLTDEQKVPNSARAKYYVGDTKRNLALEHENKDTAAFRIGMIDAIETYRKAFSINNKYSDCCERLGFCFLRLDYYYPGRHYIDTAIKYLDKSIELFPYDALAYYNRAEASYVSNDYRTAIDYYYEVLQFDNEFDHLDSNYKIANCYYSCEVYDTAMLYYINEIERRKKEDFRPSPFDSIGHADLYYKFGYCYTELSKKEIYTPDDRHKCQLEALKMYDTVLSYSPYHFEAYSETLKILVGMGNWQKTIDYAKAAIAKNKYYEDGYFYAAVAYIQQNRLDEAEQNLKKVLEYNPVNFTAYYNYAYLHSLRGNLQQAEIYQQKGIKYEKMKEKK